MNIQLFCNRVTTMNTIKEGVLLISDPFLQDPNFMRTVVLVCEHNREGSVGFVLNRQYHAAVGMVLDTLSFCDYPLFYGGPVQPETLHFIHCRPDLIEGSTNIGNGIFWGGNLESVTDQLKAGNLSESDIRFFIGYSGWGEAQLDMETDTKSWILRNATRDLVFTTEADAIWKTALKELGGEYEQMIHYPIDPQLN